MKTIAKYRMWLLLALVGTLLAAGCDTSTEADGRVVNGVDLDVLFAPAEPAEIQAILDDWAQRDVSVQELEIVTEDTLALIGSQRALAKVISHRVAGVRHYGAVVVPLGTSQSSFPVLVYNHGGDGGENLDATIGLLALGINRIVSEFIFVVPSFRDEPLTVHDVTYRSEGPPSPWNYDVDDALALLNAALETTPEADPERIGAFGFSRGGGVALLMGIRDPRIDLVAEFFGPTDFFIENAQETVESALRGEVRSLPGLDFLNEAYIQPLQRGEITMVEARLEAIRRSSVLFAELLPDVQIQHGELDVVVDVGHAHSLNDVLSGMGRTGESLEFHLYENAGHTPLEMSGSFDRLIDFVSRLLE